MLRNKNSVDIKHVNFEYINSTSNVTRKGNYFTFFNVSDLFNVYFTSATAF